MYLVYENFDNCQSYEDRDYYHEVIAVCSTKEIAEQIVEKRRDEILNKEYESWGEDKVTARLRNNDDLTWDIMVWVEDTNAFCWTTESGVYDFEIIEREQDKLFEVSPY